MGGDKKIPMPSAPPRPAPLYKQKSWSPDLHREEAWLQKKKSSKLQRCRSKSVTDEDLYELKACIELGFGFDSPEVDPTLSNILPALELYYAVNKQYNKSISRSSSSSSINSDFEFAADDNLFDSGEDPKTMKTRLRQWAQVVACTVKQSSSSC